MLSRRSFLVLGSALLSVTTLATPSEAGRIHHGHTRGGFDLPDSTDDGHILGTLKSRGHVRFVLRARTLEISATEGEIEGVLHRPDAPSGAPPFALVRGSYHTDASGQRGRFRMVVLKEDAAGNLHRIGRIRGRFLDDQPNGTPGHYRGAWVLR